MSPEERPPSDDRGCPAYAPPADGVWPSPLADGTWTAPDGTTWRARGRDGLTAVGIRRLVRRGAAVAHVYLSLPHVHEGASRDALLDVVEAYLRGGRRGTTSFAVGELRAPDGRVLVLVEEGC